MPVRQDTLSISPTGTFEDLFGQVKRAGLMRPRRDYFVVKLASNLALMAACWVALVVIGDSWWQMLVSVALALAFVQTGFIAHDTGHKQISKSRRSIRLLGMLHMNLLMGTAFGWWENHHNRHHSSPNNLDQDPDTLRRQVIFDVTEMPAKATSGFRRFI